MDRTPGRVTLQLLDLDHCKLVNDRHGRQAGDELLQEVTVRLCAQLRDWGCDAAQGFSLGRPTLLVPGPRSELLS